MLQTLTSFTSSAISVRIFFCSFYIFDFLNKKKKKKQKTKTKICFLILCDMGLW